MPVLSAVVSDVKLPFYYYYFPIQMFAGNSWGENPDGTGCVGCGPQEQFYGCADITIIGDGETARMNAFRIHILTS